MAFSFQRALRKDKDYACGQKTGVRQGSNTDHLSIEVSGQWSGVSGQWSVVRS